MESLGEILGIIPDDWEIPWAGIGAALLGAGSALSGIAALITARRKGQNEASTATDDRADNGGREWIPSVGRSEPGRAGGDPDSDD